MENFQAAMAARSIKTVRAELDFLAETGHINQRQLSTILANLPASDVPVAIAVPNPSNMTVSIPTLQSSQNPSVSNGLNTASTPGTASSYIEKPGFFHAQQQQQPPQQPPPPAYTHPPTLSTVTAIYPYAATDDGDLNLQPNETIHVTEYVNADWWRGVNPATGQTGIFPKSYVKPLAPGDIKGEKEGYGYGNVPLQVANGPQGQPLPQGDGVGGGKGSEMGKKFGKKLGNAAIFGAGATIGSSIVGAIL